MAFQELRSYDQTLMVQRLSPANPLQMVSDLWSGLYFKAPKISSLSASELPPAFRRLLVHELGMTTTLEKRWGEPMTINLLSDNLSTRCKSLFRLVALHPQSNPEPVEIAIIRIPLTTFTPKLRILFLEAQRPFGTLLSEAGIHFQARPQAYFSCLADRELSQRTGLKEGTCLYGRVNHLLNDEGALLCETAEALPKA